VAGFILEDKMRREVRWIMNRSLSLLVRSILRFHLLEFIRVQCITRKN